MEMSLTSNGALKFEFQNKKNDPSKKFNGKLKKYSEQSLEKALFFLATANEKKLSSSLMFWSDFTNHFIESLRLDPSVETLREKSKAVLTAPKIKSFLAHAPFMTGGEYLNGPYLARQWDALLAHFSSEIKSFNGSVDEYFSTLNPELHLVGKVFFHLVENKGDEEFPFAFMATYLADAESYNEDRESATHRPLKYALEEYADDTKKMLLLLAAVKRACGFSKLIEGLFETGEIFEPLKWDASTAQKFLTETSLYNRAGIICRIPNWWRGQSKGIKFNFLIGQKKTSLFGQKSLVNFNLEMSLGENKLSEKELTLLLKQSDGLAFLKGKWVKIDKENLTTALSKWEDAKKLMKENDISFHEAMKILSGQKKQFKGLEFDDIEVAQGDWLKGLTEKLESPELARKLALSKKFSGKLRPYQEQGFNWLNMLNSLGLGGCLADDMGLGKTIQVLAFLQKLIDKNKTAAALKKNGKDLHLLILPTSLLANWEEEIKKFTPSLKFLIAHPTNPEFKKIKSMTKKSFAAYDLVITTYGLIRRFEWAAKINWSYIILDEGQAIKNPGTAQTKAIKALKSSHRLALTGTPVENHLGDLWSLFDFINPGLLGTRTEFKDQVKTLESEGQDYGPLRQIISPYILRRLKTDKKIISDLPPKIMLKGHATLSKKQAVQYSRLVSHIKESLEDSRGIKRKGLILSSLMKFKQICNHPDQYLGAGSFNPSDSGKFDLLKEIVTTIFEKREQVLIFTQFKEIIKPLNSFLAKLAGQSGLILHGGTSLKKRKEAVALFQNDDYTPYFILSLRAGGTGLNLTAANHVIHFDRWWNPAVENQATDRAYRIGQEKKVVVHRLMTKGTLEEKIDRMLEEKSQLFDAVIDAKNQKWLTEMSDEEVIDLITMDSPYEA